jgi:hypothetical protein
LFFLSQDLHLLLDPLDCKPASLSPSFGLVTQFPGFGMDRRKP